MNFTNEELADAIIAVQNRKWSKLTEAEFLLSIVNAWGNPKKTVFEKKNTVVVSYKKDKNGNIIHRIETETDIPATLNCALSGKTINGGDVYGKISISNSKKETFVAIVLWTEILNYKKNLKKGIVKYAA